MTDKLTELKSKLQEAQGQKELINSLQLPRKCNSPSGVNTSEQYHKMGIKVFTSSKGDDLFMGVKLPEGWKKESTDHSMWNNLIDDKGRVRATFFYKAAFYDREAFINFKTRYTNECKWYDEKIQGKNVMTRIVKDNSTGEILFESEKHTYSLDDEKFDKQAEDFINNNFPEYKDINAYWE